MSDTLAAIVRHLEFAALAIIIANPAEAVRLVLLLSIMRGAQA